MADHEFEFEIVLSITDSEGNDYYLHRHFVTESAELAEQEAIAMADDLRNGKATVDVASVDRTSINS